MNKNKKNIASICLSLLLLGQLSLAEETQESEKYLLAQQNQQTQVSVTSAFQNVNTSNPVQHISNEAVTPVPAAITVPAGTLNATSTSSIKHSPPLHVWYVRRPSTLKASFDILRIVCTNEAFDSKPLTS